MEMKTICRACGAAIGKKDPGAVILADSSAICGTCVGPVRIIHPKSAAWANVFWSDDAIDEYGSDEEFICVDPLADLTFDGFREALKEAEEERAARRDRYGGSKAYFRVDDHRRIIKYPGKGRRVATEEYAVIGTVLLGAVAGGDTACAVRREGRFTKTIKRVEMPRDNSPATYRTDHIPEGCAGRLIWDGDAPYVYPGDVLAID